MFRVVCVALVLLSSSVFAGHNWPIYPHVSNSSSTGIDIAWGSKGGNSLLEVGEAKGDYNLHRFVIPAGTKPHIRLNNLDPSKRYYYRVTNKKLVAEAWFDTHPQPGEEVSFTFAAIGDSGSGFDIQDEVAAQMRYLRPSFVVHTGDIIYSHGQAKHLKNKFFDPYHSLMNTSPFFLSLGNHDYDTREGMDILDAVHLPTNPVTETEHYYTFTYGNTRFIALDSIRFLTEGFEGSPQWNWLVQEFEKNSTDWTIIFFHHPLYSSGDHAIEPGMRDLHPLFVMNGVDLVINGHDHHYERTNIIDGIQYLVTGGGGANVRTPEPNSDTAFAIKAHHFVQIDVTPEYLRFRATNEKGETLDTCVWEKYTKLCSTEGGIMTNSVTDVNIKGHNNYMTQP